MDEWRSALLLAVTLITTLSFPVGINPPGGFWQDDANNHTAGSPIMRDKHHHRYLVFSISNWLCFNFSMSLIIWLFAGAPHDSCWFMFNFAFCLASLEFVYLASQPDSLLRWALATSILVFLLAGFSFYRAWTANRAPVIVER